MYATLSTPSPNQAVLQLTTRKRSRFRHPVVRMVCG